MVIYLLCSVKKTTSIKYEIILNYRGDFDFGGVNFGNSKSNCDTLRLPLGTNKFGVVDDCCALHCILLTVAVATVVATAAAAPTAALATVIGGDKDDIFCVVFSALVGSVIIVDTVGWLLFPVVLGVGVCGGEVHSCIA